MSTTSTLKHTCPECLRSFSYPEKAADRFVDCPACKQRIRLPAAVTIKPTTSPSTKGTRDMPAASGSTTPAPPRKAEPAKSKSRVPLMIGLLVAGAVLAVGLISLGAWVLFQVGKHEKPVVMADTKREEANNSNVGDEEAKEKEVHAKRLVDERLNPPIDDMQLYEAYDRVDSIVGRSIIFDQVSVWCDIAKIPDSDNYKVEITDSRETEHNGSGDTFTFVCGKPMADMIRKRNKSIDRLHSKITCQILRGKNEPTVEIQKIEQYNNSNRDKMAFEYHADGTYKFARDMQMDFADGWNHAVSKLSMLSGSDQKRILLNKETKNLESALAMLADCIDEKDERSVMIKVIKKIEPEDTDLVNRFTEAYDESNRNKNKN